MSDNVQTAMFEILKSVQASIAELQRGQSELQRGLSELQSSHTELQSGQAELQSGQAELKELARKQRRDLAGMLVMMKSVAGDFDERVGNLEQRVARLEGQRS